ncbi:CjaC [Campylobacter hyointestinalis]|uniref:CjaC n=1 Tax=Campylobacter hyointestinalis subsp. hyointestinalis TaxID=91352 RepID=A0A9W5AVL3_CAMHY|nr:transporter substrate-binding domain-containing protein [Campylobacter hyointestinalis]PPB51153.1 basic amino acid ABC transporter substrate-binding protein [Campylobacter hyointestinalis subsp. hyointestinalis]PPB51449.1 basic amino acid ABC transporter substrate-binding protein [Campylobacter hyointestinalis subsp. hyointestinalis]PPB56295.1 basic amino acid ABC transporter substrate-binding protein [Campylobacter hyointestinalis subsp. hyointestinalis]PPB59881.1 basic amino acid ABC trans
MNRVFKFIFALLLMLNLANAKTLIFGSDAEYPPFGYMDEHNKIAGFDIDLVDAISKKAGFEYKFIKVGFDALIPALKAGKIDAIAASMSATTERRKSVDFSNAYFYTKNLYLKMASDKEITSKDDLKTKRIGAMLGTVQESVAHEIKGAKVIATEGIAGSIMNLKAGKVDVVIVDSSVGYGYLKKNTDIVKWLEENDGSDGFAMAFDKDKHSEFLAKFNKALEDIKNDGTYEKLLEKYDLK